MPLHNAFAKKDGLIVQKKIVNNVTLIVNNAILLGNKSIYY